MFGLRKAIKTLKQLDYNMKIISLKKRFIQIVENFNLDDIVSITDKSFYLSEGIVISYFNVEQEVKTVEELDTILSTIHFCLYYDDIEKVIKRRKKQK